MVSDRDLCVWAQKKKVGVRLLHLVLSALTAFVCASSAQCGIVLNVPQLASAGSAPGFQFVSFDFNVYLMPLGDPGATDYSANVLANDHENYTYSYVPPCGGGGRGNPCPSPPSAVQTAASTYSSTYESVNTPPDVITAYFVFSGADVAGEPLKFTVTDNGKYTLTLRDSMGNPVTLGTALSNGLYTLEYQTNSILGSQVIVTEADSTAPEPTNSLLVGMGLLILFTLRFTQRGTQSADSN